MMDLMTALFLGMIHGITPDEHTWPITFSYAIGSYSTKGGMRAGFYFSAAFTAQRAIVSQLAYFALAGFLMKPGEETIIYFLVGLVMALYGYYVLNRGKSFRFLPWVERLLPAVSDNGKPIPVNLALLHGFVAGWGIGAMATILYTVIAPTMPTPWLGFMPGFLYGAGSTIMQVIIGAAFGRWMEQRNLGDKAKAFIGRYVAGNTLLYGGILFVFIAIIAFWLPGLMDWGIATGVHIHNLDTINVALLLVIVIMAGIGGSSIWRALLKVKEKGAS
ncbi:hypothetical protein [Ferroacidibacillus organovorans]|nr:hypothetical protein [Ferroacidibacillus organovorans]